MCLLWLKMFTVKPLNESSKFGLQIWIWPRAGAMLNIAIYSRDIQWTTCSAALHCFGVKSYAFQCCSGNVGASAKTTYVKTPQKYNKYEQLDNWKKPRANRRSYLMSQFITFRPRTWPERSHWHWKLQSVVGVLFSPMPFTGCLRAYGSYFFDIYGHRKFYPSIRHVQVTFQFMKVVGEPHFALELGRCKPGRSSCQ